MRLNHPWLEEYLPDLVGISTPDLADKLTMAGHETEAVGKDQFEIKVAANRGDCLSVYGLCRDLSALYRWTFRPPSLSKLPKTDAFFPLEINPRVKKIVWADCLLLLENYRSVKSPPEVADRLKLLGLNPKELLIDLTNLVAQEIGLPLHVFDYRSVKSGLELDFARSGEKMTLINDRAVSLTSTSLIQRSQGEPVDLIGIFGGKSSALRDGSQTVLVQAGSFAPEAIGRSSEQLGVSSEASRRYRRYVDPELAPLALRRFLYLAQNSQKNLQAAHYQPHFASREPVAISLDRPRLSRILGREVGEKEIAGLARIGLSVKDNSVIVPGQRADLRTLDDLAEEIARISGYDSFAPIQLTERPVQPSQYHAISQLKTALMERGWVEAVTHSLSPSGVIALKNPPNNRLRYLRPDLQGGLLDMLMKNSFLKRLKLFEIGEVFPGREETQLALILAGPHDLNRVSTEIEEITFWKPDWQKLAEEKLSDLNVRQRPVREASVELSRLRLPKSSSVLPAALRPIKPISKFPPVVRDLTLLVGSTVSPRQIIEILIKNEAVVLVEQIDSFRSASWGDRVALTFRLLISDLTQSLTDSQAEVYLTNCLKDLGKKVKFQLH